jgi:hypothetical protein
MQRMLDLLRIQILRKIVAEWNVYNLLLHIQLPVITSA